MRGVSTVTRGVESPRTTAASGARGSTEDRVGISSRKLASAYSRIPGIKALCVYTGLLGEEASGLWHRIPGEEERLRRKVVWQSCSAQREECGAVEKIFRVIHTSNVSFTQTFPRKSAYADANGDEERRGGDM